MFERASSIISHESMTISRNWFSRVSFDTSKNIPIALAWSGGTL